MPIVEPMILRWHLFSRVFCTLKKYSRTVKRVHLQTGTLANLQYTNWRIPDTKRQDPAVVRMEKIVGFDSRRCGPFTVPTQSSPLAGLFKLQNHNVQVSNHAIDAAQWDISRLSLPGTSLCSSMINWDTLKLPCCQRATYHWGASASAAFFWKMRYVVFMNFTEHVLY